MVAYAAEVHTRRRRLECRLILQMLRDLIAHKGYANAALREAIRQNAAASSDPALRELLHHILIANRFWLLTILTKAPRTKSRRLAAFRR
jgi:hypothetical protein